MIKKILLSLGIIGLGIINFSSAYIGNNCEFSTNGYYNVLDNNVLTHGGVITQNFGVNKKVFYLNSSDFFFWSTDNLPYGFMVNGNLIYQGYFKRYWVCNLITTDSTPTGCTTVAFDGVNFDSLRSFLDSITCSDTYYYVRASGPNDWFCYNSSTYGKSLCFHIGYNNSYADLSGSLNIPSSSSSFDSLDISLLGDPPGRGGGNSDDEVLTGGIEIDSEESAIVYFEDYLGRDESICYAGVDNVTDLWGASGVSFEQGSGLNLFQVYTGIYNTGVELDHVYVWLNNRLINHENWFGTNGNPQYLSNYNSGTNQVDIYYDNLTFPFAGNPVAVYFLSDNIERLSSTSTMGSEVVSYCNIKVNNGTFDEILSNAIKNNIRINTEQVNYSNGYNRDGTLRQFSGFMDGTGIDFMSGVDIEEFTGDMSDFFDRTIDKFKSFVDNNSNLFTGVLPNWLIFAFLLIVLFKILRNY